MILVVAMLVLMVLAGTAYMQRARLDRMSTDQAANKGNIDQVTAAAVEQIKSVLRDDLIDDPAGATPQFLNPAAPAYDEPYDYPWTNAASAFDVATQYQQTWNLDGSGNTIRARGGQLDDMWLASSYPTGLDTNYGGAANTFGWEHITNLNGIYLDLPRPTAKDGSKLPIEWVISKATSGGGNWDGYGAGNANDPQTNTNTAQTDTNLPLFDGAGNIPNPPTGTAASVGTLTLSTNPLAPPISRLAAVSDPADYQPRGYDVDGDGVPDSRWTWAPIRQANGIDYVMAVRIIDNSSMINVNSAGAQTADGQNNFPNQPLGAWPTSADLSRLMRQAGGGNNGNWDTSISALIARRWPAKPPASALGFAPSPGLTVTNTQMTFDRLSGLGEASRYWGSPGFPPPATDVWSGLLNYGAYGRDLAWFGPADEIALRLGNGVRSARFGQTDLETYLASPAGIARLAWDEEEENFLRVSDPAHVDSDPATYVDRVNVRDYFEGNGADANQPLSQRQFADIRKWLTTWSGAAELTGMWQIAAGSFESRRTVFPLPPMNFSAGVGSTPTTRTADHYAMFDVATAGDQNDLPELRDRLRRILNIGNPTGTPPTTYQGLSTDEADAAGAWMASAIFNAASAGSRPKGIAVPGGGATRYYGLERLPFIRTVYLQGRYKSDVIAFDNDPSSPTFGAPILGWVYQQGSEAIAVEIANPFVEPIDCTGISGNLRLTVRNGTATRTWDLNAAAFSAMTLNEGDFVIFYMDPSDKSASEGNSNDMSAGLLTGEPKRVALDDTTPLNWTAAGVAEFSLQVQDVDGNWVTYDRYDDPSLSVASGDSGTAPMNPGLISHCQVSSTRPGNMTAGATDPGPYFVSNASVASKVHYLGDPYVAAPATFRLGVLDKGVYPAANLYGLRLSIPDRPMLNPTELMSLPILGFSDGLIGTGAGIGPTTGQSFADWLNFYSIQPPPRGGAYDPHPGGTEQEQILRCLFLDFSDRATIPQETGVAHAALVLEALSTVSPQLDRMDNDNDDDDEPRTNADGDGVYATGQGPPELFVPGKINVNTAPMHVIAMAAPLPEPLDANVQPLAEAIVAYRSSQVPPAGNPSSPKDIALTSHDATIAEIRNNFSRIYASAGPPVVWLPVRGIVSLGELMWLRDAGMAARNMDIWSIFDGEIDAAKAGGALRPREIDVTDTNFAQGEADIAGSAEKLAARFRYFNQVFTTRSDVYTAYIEVRGYPSDDYRKGPVERTRLIVVFDRGGVVGPAVWNPGTPTGPRPDGQVRIIAMYRY